MKMLVASCTSGLCNRIHSILGASVLANKFKREFRVHWPRTKELDASFHDVFEPGFATISNQRLMDAVLDNGKTTAIYNSGYGRSTFETDAVSDSDHDLILVKPWFVPIEKPNVYDLTVFTAMRAELSALRFTRTIAERVKTDDTWIGVHIRHGDYWDGSTLSNAEIFERSSIDLFKQSMELLANKIERARFYVSSPCNELKVELAKSFDVDYAIVNPTRSVDGGQSLQP